MSFGMSQTGGSNAPMISLMNQGLDWIKDPLERGLQEWEWYQAKGEEAYKQGEEYLNWSLNNLFGTGTEENYYGNLLSESEHLADMGIPAVGFSGPGGVQWGIDNEGKVTYNRGEDAQAYMDRLLSGYATDVSDINTLLGKVQPGMGELSNQWIEQLGLQQRSAMMDVKAQQEARRVQGASFADQYAQSVRSEYDKQIGLAAAEATKQEMDMTSQYLAQRTQAILGYISTAFNQLQFEGNIGTALMTQAQNSALHMQDLSSDMFKAAATMRFNMDQGRLSALTGIGMPVMNLMNTVPATTATGRSGLLDSYMNAGAGLYGQTIGAVGQNEAAQGSSFSFGLSDRRLKENIELVGVLFDGTPVWRFNFRGDPMMQIGLMADDVEQRYPEAVATNEHGYKLVNYALATQASVGGQ